MEIELTKIKIDWKLGNYFNRNITNFTNFNYFIYFQYKIFNR